MSVAVSVGGRWADDIPGTAIVPLSFRTPRLDLGMPSASLRSTPPLAVGNWPKNHRCLTLVRRVVSSGEVVDAWASSRAASISSNSMDARGSGGGSGFSASVAMV